MICPEDTEQWRPVPIAGYEAAYEVSNYGRVRRTLSRTCGKAGNILRPIRLSSGRYFVRLSGPDGIKQMKVYRLVLMAFVGPCPAGKQCCHWDGDLENNRLTNLRWGTPVENAADKIRHGTMPYGERSTTAKLTADQVVEIRHRLAEGEEQIPLGLEFGVSQASISAVARRKSWRHV